MNAEGWYLDPYELHEARWFSDGRATALVRDAGVEAFDAPPASPHSGTLEPAPHPHVMNGENLRRVGDDDDARDPRQAAERAWGVFDRTSGA